jgi:hypothetical protein
MTRPAGAFAEPSTRREAPRLASAPNMSGEDLRLAPHPIEEIGPDQHAEAAPGIGERRRVPPGIIDVRSLSQFLELLLGFTSGVIRSFSGATGVGASLSMFGELFGGTVPEGPVSNACDG